MKLIESMKLIRLIESMKLIWVDWVKTCQPPDDRRQKTEVFEVGSRNAASGLSEL
jgi:hypothetical protein